MGRDSSEWEPVVWPDWEKFIPPRELWVGPEDPVMHFFRWPWEYRAYLILLCELQAHSSVLELGCSHGRTALGLLEYLLPPGRYEGLDILPLQIEFARENIQRAVPHFRFTLADVHNTLYNPQGKESAETFEFPYEDSAFDVVYAASVFTHLLPPAGANYLKQARRVIRPGGKCLFSFFLLDYYGGKGTSWSEYYEFEHSLPAHEGVAVHDPAGPERVLSYRIEFLEKLAADAGFAITRILPGFWSKTQPLSLNEQDLVVLEAIA